MAPGTDGDGGPARTLKEDRDRADYGGDARAPPSRQAMFRSVLLAVLLGLPLVAGQGLEAPRVWADDARSQTPDPAGCAAPRLSRIHGATRVTTAAAVSRRAWSAAEEVILASAEDYPDALSGAVLAAQRDAPTLLTARDGLLPEVERELARLRPSRVWLVGGESALSETVRRQVERTAARPRAVRLAGSDRYATAAAIARERGPSRVVTIASGTGFPDAVSAGALAATPARVPTLLTPPDRLHGATRDALRDLRPEVVHVIGGEAAVRTSIDRELRDAGYAVERLAGADRYRTSAAVAARAVQALGGRLRGAVFATGADFPDALSAAALAARTGGMLTLVPPATSELPHALASRLTDDRDRLVCSVVVGGPAAVSPGTADLVAHRLRVHPPDTPRPVDRPCDRIIRASTDGTDQTDTIQDQLDGAPDGTEGDPTVVCFPVGHSSGRYRVDGSLVLTGRQWLEVRGPSPDDQATIHTDVDGITAGYVGHTGQSSRRHWQVIGSRDVVLRNLRVEGPFSPDNERFSGITRRDNALGQPGYAYFDDRFEGEIAFEIRGSHRISLFDTSSDDVGGDHLTTRGMTGSSELGSTDITMVRAHADHPHRHGVAATHVDGLLVEGLTVVKGGYHYVDFEPIGEQDGRRIEIRNGDADVFLLAFGAAGRGPLEDVHIHHNAVRFATPSWALVHVDGNDPAVRRVNWSVTDNVAEHPIGSCSTSGLSSAFHFAEVDGVELRRNTVRIKPGWSCNALAHFHDVGGDVWLTDSVAHDGCTEYRWFVDGGDRTGTSSDLFVRYPDRLAGNRLTGDRCRS